MRTSLSRKCCPPAARAGEMLWQHRGLQGTFPKEQEVPLRACHGQVRQCLKLGMSFVIRVENNLVKVENASLFHL